MVALAFDGGGDAALDGHAQVHERQIGSVLGEEFERYCDRVPPWVPRSTPIDDAQGQWSTGVVRTAESKTFVTFAAMLFALWLKACKTP